MTKVIRIFGVVVMVFAISCLVPPDIVVRPGNHFTKDSTITLTATQDTANYKLDIEKELLRFGFNVISESVAQIVSQEKKSGDIKAAGVATAEGQTDKAAAGAEGKEVTEKSTSRQMKSEYVGKIEYSGSRVNLTIIELNTGAIVISIGVGRNQTRDTNVAQQIAKELDAAVSGTK